jgi:4-hydroxy-tetrahydrodipicolinate synthase
MRQRFQGVYSVVLTPLTKDGHIDARALKNTLDFLIESGVHGLVILGSNGESPYLNDRERREVIDRSLEANNNRVPVIVGTTSISTDQTIELGIYAREAGADALLAALPLYYPLEEEDIVRHYQALSDEVRMPVLYYNFPMATHLTLTPEQIHRISTIPHVVGVKESITDMDEVERLVKLTQDIPFDIFTGTCMNFFLALQKGVHGVICPIVNLVPREIVALWDAFQRGDLDQALELQMSFSDLAVLFSSTPTPHAIMKEAMRRLGHDMGPTVKRPLPQLTPHQQLFVENILRKAGMIHS